MSPFRRRLIQLQEGKSLVAIDFLDLFVMSVTARISMLLIGIIHFK